MSSAKRMRGIFWEVQVSSESAWVIWWKKEREVHTGLLHRSSEWWNVKHNGSQWSQVMTGRQNNHLMKERKVGTLAQKMVVSKTH